MIQTYRMDCCNFTAAPRRQTVIRSCECVLWKDMDRLSSDVERQRVRRNDARLLVHVRRMDTGYHALQQVSICTRVTRLITHSSVFLSWFEVQEG